MKGSVYERLQNCHPPPSSSRERLPPSPQEQAPALYPRCFLCCETRFFAEAEVNGVEGFEMIFLLFGIVIIELCLGDLLLTIGRISDEDN
jgi:hypothetical protein